MVPQPLDDPLPVAGHRCGRSVVHVAEDRVERRPGALHESLDMVVDLAIDVREEEQLLVSLDHEAREVHGAELILHLREIGHQRGQLVA